MNLRRLMLIAYTCSGFAGLVYQVTWTRLMLLHVGNTTAAITTVVAAFMGGLAVGAAVGAAYAPRFDTRRALTVYAVLEGSAAACALLLPVALAVGQPLLSWAYHDDVGRLTFSLIRAAACLTVVAIPSVMLGATFPTALRSVSQQHGPPLVSGGRLYAVNTAGAAVGSLAAGFLLLPLLGLRLTTLIGAGASLAALAAALLARTAHRHAAAERPQPAPGPGTPRISAWRLRSGAVETIADTRDVRTAAIIVTSTGFAGLLYEVAWTRAVASLLGPTTYAFAGILFMLIAGLAVGSALGSTSRLRALRPHLALSGILAATALIIWWGNLGLGTSVPANLAASFATSSDDSIWSLLIRLGSTLVPIVPAAVGLGAAFPVALRLAGTDAEAPRRISLLYALNTIAGVLGTMLAGQLLLRVGLEGALRIVPVALLAAAAWSMLVSGGGRVVARGLATGGLLGLAALLSIWPVGWDRELLASGIYKYARTIPSGPDLDALLRAATLLYYRDGQHATVSVSEFAGNRSLAIDGKVDGSSGADMLNQKLAAHLPMLLHEQPRAVLVIGLGTGVTAGAAAVHPVDSIDVVEISPEVVRASAYFREQNRDVLANPKVHLIVGDGRSHLGLTTRRYDVIVSEPSNPWVAGMAALFTRESFAAMRSRLAPGGIVCQWLHTYDITEADLRSVVATFDSVFPDSTLWAVGEGDLLLVASTDPLDRRLTNIAESWKRAGVAADLERVGVRHPFSLLSLWASGPQALAGLGRGVPLQTDDRMTLEFSGPLAVYRKSGSSQSAFVRKFRASANLPAAVQLAFDRAGAPQWRDRAAMLEKIHVYDDGYADYARAFALDPSDAASASGLASTAIPAGKTAEAIDRLSARLKSEPSSVAVRVALSRLLSSIGETDAALAAARSSGDGAVDQPGLLEQLAALYAGQGDVANLERTVVTLQTARPNASRTRYYAAMARYMRNDFAGALDEASRSLRDAPADAETLTLAGSALASLGRLDEARAAFESALKETPSDPTIYANLGLLSLRQQNPQRAAKSFAVALTLDPSFRPALEGLQQATSRQPR